MLNFEEIARLFALRNAIGSALSIDQQLWVSQNYKGLESFLHSDLGKLAAVTFVEDWMASDPNKTTLQ